MSTFQIDFMGEEREDNGGPRREWLMKQAIKEKNLNHGLRPLFAQDYFYAEIMIAVVLLRNGQTSCLCRGKHFTTSCFLPRGF